MSTETLMESGVRRGFDDILREIAEGCGGAIGAALMQSDGIPIAEVRVDTAPAGPLAEEIGTAGVEFGRILDEIRKASDALGGGALEETCVRLAGFDLVLRVVDEDAFLVLVLRPDGNLGKARYLIRRNLLALREEL